MAVTKLRKAIKTLGVSLETFQQRMGWLPPSVVARCTTAEIVALSRSFMNSAPAPISAGDAPTSVNESAGGAPQTQPKPISGTVVEGGFRTRETRPSARATSVEVLTSGPVPPTMSRLIVERGGRSLTPSIPKPVVLIDTREQSPWDLGRFGNWIDSTRRSGLATGDYTVAGLEDLLAIERKSLPDLVSTLTNGRQRFFREMQRMSSMRYRWLIIEASLADVKSPYTHFGNGIAGHPNGIVGTLDAISTRWGIEVLYASSRDLASEKAASLLSKAWTYEWLTANGLGRVLQERDGL